MRHSRTLLAVLAALAAAMPFLAACAPVKKGKMSRGKVLAEVVAARVAENNAAPSMPPAGFAAQSRRRSSSNGGATWSAEKDLSTYVAGYSYIQTGGFSYPFGDYFEMDIDDRGDTHAVWGEGLDYQTPGAIWYTRGR